MTFAQFHAILQRRLESIAKLAGSDGTKTREYEGSVERFRNFKAAGAIIRKTPEQACLAMFSKHLTSIIDLVEAGQPVPREVIDEKLGDAINYLCLLEGIMLDRAEQ